MEVNNTVYILPYGRGRPGERVGSMRTRGGRGGKKLAKFCGRLLWMATKWFTFAIVQTKMLKVITLNNFAALF